MRPYNPLDKNHLADSIAREFFKRELHPLPPSPFPGAGIYAIYYRGDFCLYNPIALSCKKYESAVEKGIQPAGITQPMPLYIGKSDPPGSRKGLYVGAAEEADATLPEEEAQELLTETPKHRRLFARLTKHAKSIGMTRNLRLEDFRCRYMLVDEIWVPLGEARLVATFTPLWNVLIEGFGSNPEGGGRKDTARSVWDILHPGRKEDLGIQVNPAIEERILQDLRGAKDTDELARAVAQHRDAKKAFAKARKETQGKLASA